MTSLALHPVAGANPSEVLWRVGTAAPGFVGEVAYAPGLEELRTDGVIDAIIAEPNAVRIVLSSGHSWRQWGAIIRTALAASLVDPDLWEPRGERDADAVLAALAAQLCCGEVGEFIRSHGGRIDVVDAKDGVVTVDLGGACDHCPALGFTLQARVERALREEYPALVRVDLAS